MPNPELPVDSKVSDRSRLLKLIDGQPLLPKQPPQVAELPDKALSALSGLTNRLHKMGFDKREMIIIAVICAAVLFFFVSKFFMTGKKEMKTFAVSEDAATSERAIPSRLPAEDLAAQGLGLRLVGVDWGETPVALMEDTKSGKTYFVRNHDKILGATVKQIEKNRVIVSYRGQNVELR